MIDSIGIIGFLILLYTVYLIITDGSKKDNKDVAEDSSNEVAEVAKESTTPKAKKSTPVQKIEDDDTDVLRQGKNYTEQESTEANNVTPREQQHHETEQTASVQTNESEVHAPSTKNQEEQANVEMVSVVCPYCDNKVLIPKGGSAECSCCSSILNDTGTVVG